MRTEPSLNRYICICIYTSVVMGNGVESIQGAMINSLIYCQGFMINFWANSFHKMCNWQFTRMRKALNLYFYAIFSTFATRYLWIELISLMFIVASVRTIVVTSTIWHNNGSLIRTLACSHQNIIIIIQPNIKCWLTSLSGAVHAQFNCWYFCIAMNRAVRNKMEFRQYFRISVHSLVTEHWADLIWGLCEG